MARDTRQFRMNKSLGDSLLSTVAMFCLCFPVIVLGLVNLGAFSGPIAFAVVADRVRLCAYLICISGPIAAFVVAQVRLRSRRGRKRKSAKFGVESTFVVLLLICSFVSMGTAIGYLKSSVTSYSVTGDEAVLYEMAMEANVPGSPYCVVLQPGEGARVVVRNAEVERGSERFRQAGISLANRE